MSTARRRSWPLYAGVLFVIAGLVTGALMLTGAIGDQDDDPPERRPFPPGAAVTPVPSGLSGPSVEPATPAPPDSPGDGVLALQSWGRASGQLALVVRNVSTEPLAHARVRVEVRDSAGAILLSTSGTVDDVCCTVVGLPPRKDFGLFVPIEDGVDAIGDVDVVVLSARTGSSLTGARAKAARARLHRSADDTVVSVRVRAHGDLTGHVAVQALLEDDGGDLAQVISGRFYCFRPGVARTVRLRLFHAVPADVELDRVVAYPIPEGVRPRVPGRCR